MEHKSWQTWFLKVTMITISLVLRSHGVCIEEERTALLEIKASLINSYGYGADILVLPTWVDHGECCDWERVKCNRTTGHVTTLLLKNLNSNLEDDISKDPAKKLWPLNISLFLHFEELGSLDLSSNYLDNEVLNTDIDMLLSLEKLEILDLSSNFEIDNDILPALTTLTSLRVLNLSYTSLEGYFPTNEFASLENLEILDLTGCSFHGTFQMEGSGKAFILTKLETLILNQNSFNESLISSLKLLPSLKNLDLSRNKLYGSFPPQDLTYLTNLEKLDFSGNSWLTTTSSIQDCKRLSRLKRLESITLESSNFNRSIISCLDALPSLKILDLRGSLSLAGTFPFKELSGLRDLETLDLGNCGLNSLVFNGTMTSLLHLNLDKNFFDEDTMMFLDAFPSLQFLSLDTTRFSGEALAQELPYMPNLEVLLLGNNMLSGRLSMEALASFPHLEILDLSNNNLDGNLPSEIRALSFLRVLYLAQNNLNGSLSPQGLCKMKNLQELDLSYNMFEGNLPQCFSELSLLKVLEISSNQFTGVIPPSLFANLTSLEYINFSQNKFEGLLSFSTFANHTKLEVVEFISDNDKFEVETEEPSHWIPLFQLKVLVLSSCNMNKHKGNVVPSFLLLQHQLRVLDLSHNSLKGILPNWLLENNTMLEVLYLRNNSFGGSIRMPKFRNLHFMELDTSANHIMGTIPGNIVTFFPSLTFLNLSMNSLSGSLPSSINSMGALNILDLSDNKFAGEVPENLFTENSSLSLLKLSDNRFHGEVFSGNISSYKFGMLLLDNNHFTGELSNNKSFDGSVLDISNNFFSGALPRGVSNSSSMLSLSARNNLFEGHFPCGTNSVSFQFLDISHNSFSGPIPSCLDLEIVEHLHLESNRFTGSIPNTFKNLTSVLTLDIGNNYLSGKIPEFLGELSSLRILLLGGNNFSDSIPKQLCQLTSVSLVDLSSNSLSGSIPSCLQNITGPNYLAYLETSITTYYWGSSYKYSGVLHSWYSMIGDNPLFDTRSEVEFTTKSISYLYKGNILDYMNGLDLSSNNLTGEIPEGLGLMTQIRALNLSHNQLTGSVPAQLSELTKIESLDLSSNHLSGQIPSELVTLPYLAVFNVSYNNLSGRLPEMKGQFSTFTNASYKGNPLLCGLPLVKKCTTTQPATVPSAKEDTEKGFDIDIVWFIGSLSSTWVVFLLGFAAILYMNPYWHRMWFYFIEECMYACYYFLIDLVSRPSVLLFRR